MYCSNEKQYFKNTIIFPVTDPLVRDDTSAPLCAEVESILTSYAQIVEDILEGGPDRIDITPENENSRGNWTTLRSYTNINILKSRSTIS